MHEHSTFTHSRTNTHDTKHQSIAATPGSIVISSIYAQGVFFNLQSGDLVKQSTGRRSTVTLSTVTQSTATQSAIRQSTVPQSTSRTSHDPIAHSASATTTTTTTTTLSANLIASPRCRPASLRACYAARLALLPHLARSDDAHVWDDHPRSSPCRKKRQNAQANNTETYYLAPPEAAAPPCKISAVSR